MSHVDDGTLHAYLDGELGEAERGVARTHLGACPECGARLEQIESTAGRVRAHLAPVAPGHLPAARAAFNQLRSRRLASEKENPPMLKSIFAPRLRPMWAGLSLVAALAVASSFAPVRAWAGEFLGLFRVRQVTVVPVDTTRLSALTGNETLAKQISALMSDSVKITKEPADPRVVASAAEASAAAGFTIRLPGSRADAPVLTVQDGAAFQFTVDLERAQSLLTESGYATTLPATLAGAVIAVDIPAGVSAAYGACPPPTEEEEGNAVTGSPGRRFVDCLLLAQIPSPTVTTPPDVDVAALAEIGLQFTGMTPDEAHAFAQSVDWTSTLVIPIPRNGSRYEQISVDGVTGNLIQRPSDDAAEFALIWVKDGIIYAIGGLGSNVQPALDMANSMH